MQKTNQTGSIFIFIGHAEGSSQVYNWRPELVCPNIHRPPALLLLISPFISRLEAASQNRSFSIRSQSYQPFNRKLSRDAKLKSDQFTIVLKRQITKRMCIK